MCINTALFDNNRNYDRMEKIGLAFLWFIICLESGGKFKQNQTLAVMLVSHSCFPCSFYHFTDKCGLALTNTVELRFKMNALMPDDYNPCHMLSIALISSAGEFSAFLNIWAGPVSRPSADRTSEGEPQ